MVRFSQFLSRPEGWLLGLILIGGAALRLYHLRLGMQYMGDEGRDLLIAREIIIGKNLPAVGPPTSVGNLYLGPLYFYLITPFLWLSGLDPVGPAVFIALLSIATIGLVYGLGKVMFNSFAGLAAAFLFAISPLAVEFGRWPWNPNIMPFFATLFAYSLWQALEKKREWWIMVTGICLAAILQSHYLGLAAFPVLVISLLAKRPKVRDFTYWMVAGLLFLALMSPLLAFDLNHDFLNARGFWQIVTERTGSGVNVGSILSHSRDRLRQATGLFTGFGERSMSNNLLLVAGLGVWLALAKEKKRWWLLVAWLFGGTLFLGLYQGPFHVHYLEFLLSPVAIFLGAIFSLVWEQKPKVWRWIAGAGIAVLGGVFLPQSLRIVNQTKVPNVETTKELVTFIGKESGGEPFNFALLAQNNYDSAYRYFFAVANLPAEFTTQTTGHLFVVCEGEQVCQPEGNPKWEIALFDAAYDGKIEKVNEWEFYNYIRVFHFKPRNVSQ